MLSALLLSRVLVLGQPAPPADPPPAPETPAAPAEIGLLMRSLQGTCVGSLLDAGKVRIQGWTELSFTASSTRFDQLPMGFNYRADEFLLQQHWLRIERPVDPKADTPTLGFRSDTILPGSDYRFTVARGLFSGQLTADNGEPNTYGIDPVQFYAEASFPHIGKGLDVKVGRFFAQYGVESIDTTLNALASHGYTFIYNPFTHTGVLATLQLTDAWSVQNGLVTGCDVFIDPAATPTYVGSVKWAPPDGRDTVLFSMILGTDRFNQGRNFHNPEIFDLVFTHKVDSRLTYSFEGLYGFTSNVPQVGFANWFGILNYLTCEFTPKLSGTARLEFFNDAQGQRTGFEGLYTALTAGVSYKPTSSVTLRPEVRYDCNTDSRPFEGKRSLYTAALDLILRW